MRDQLLRLLPLVLVIANCTSGSLDSREATLTTPDGGKCGSGQFLYDDFSCPPPGACSVDGGGCTQCEHEGDDLCHPRCKSNSDCTDPRRPYCRVLGLFAGYDWNCNVGVRICREMDKDDCPHTPPTLQ